MNPKLKNLLVSTFLPLAGIGVVVGLWWLASATVCKGQLNPDTGLLEGGLPSPLKTWQESKLYITEPFAKRGELDRGILAFTWLSLALVLKGYALAILIGAPLGFLMGASALFRKTFDPVFQILRPVSPLAWLPLGFILFAAAGKNTSEFAAIFTLAICAMWPTVLNTAVGVRAIPQDYHNVAKVLRLSKAQTLFKILLPAAMPHMFTGFRLSLGIAWLVIVAVEMLTGRPGIGGFLWQEYNANLQSHIILCILTIGLVGFGLDRLMSLAEARIGILFALPGRIRRGADWLAGRIERRNHRQIDRHKAPSDLLSRSLAKAAAAKEDAHVLS